MHLSSAYVRVSRSATEDVYDEKMVFKLDEANIVSEGNDVMLIACGEMVPYAVEAAKILKEKGIDAGVLDMYCLKPFDEKAVIKYAEKCKMLVTIEEHSGFGGLGSLTAQTTAQNCPCKVEQIALPDAHLIPGNNKEVFAYYQMDGKGIAERTRKALETV